MTVHKFCVGDLVCSVRNLKPRKDQTAIVVDFDDEGDPIIAWQDGTKDKDICFAHDLRLINSSSLKLKIKTKMVY